MAQKRPDEQRSNKHRTPTHSAPIAWHSRIQYGALMYRHTKARHIEILLITNRNTKRWIISKGWSIKA